MNEPIIKFTLDEAQWIYRDNPTVRCLTDESINKIDSTSIHSVKYEEFPEPWIWAKNEQRMSVLLYAPSSFNESYVKAEIIEE